MLAGRDQGRLDALAERLSRNSDGVKLETAVAGSEGPGPLRELIPAGRLGEPNEVARVVEFLADLDPQT